MGTNMIKVSLDLSYGGKSYADFPALLSANAIYKQVFDMPFSKYFCWVGGSPSSDVYAEADRYNDSIQMFNLTKYLLTTYNNTGKTYYLGNWEGDWLFLKSESAYVPSDARVQAFIKWARTRQNAVDAAKALYAHSNVDVFLLCGGEPLRGCAGQGFTPIDQYGHSFYQYRLCILLFLRYSESSTTGIQCHAGLCGIEFTTQTKYYREACFCW